MALTRKNAARAMARAQDRAETRAAEALAAMTNHAEALRLFGEAEEAEKEYEDAAEAAEAAGFTAACTVFDDGRARRAVRRAADALFEAGILSSRR